ncbi:cytochrome-c peroxidase [Rhodobium gokarnense]|uniref:Cytochrome c peroxidase n=1 Tax=Rhodobium gokarnense TaxID=364296 RepID=A0ABT3H606_9HYPH|nr:cytochrome c peroxidase [Rhodobium gokarnense]MCW2305825.1 cytochrome c peroxidase [Rhodobium gokarnense]
MTVALLLPLLAVCGLGVLVLVSGELSRRLGVASPGRIGLAALLGFGILAMSIKAVVLLSLQPTGALAAVAAAARAIDPASAERMGRSADLGLSLGTPSLQPFGRDKAWKALPVATDVPDAALVDLGRRLFFDKRLSADGTVSCASCHDIAGGGDDGRPTAVGIAGATGTRNAPTVLNAGFLRRLFWDGRAASLEEQALGPLLNPVEMGLPSMARAVAIVAGDADYRARFAEALSAPVTAEDIVRAIAAFERTLVTPGSAYDRFVLGDDDALSARQKRGLFLFDEIGCRTCHADPWFTVAGDRYASPYRLFPVFRTSPLLARFALTADAGRNGAGVWRVPSLRNVALTAPYFHNGSVDTLEDAVRIMAEAQLRRSTTGDVSGTTSLVRDRAGRPVVGPGRVLTETDIADIAAFLRSLTGVAPVVDAPSFQKRMQLRLFRLWQPSPKRDGLRLAIFRQRTIFRW